MGLRQRAVQRAVAGEGTGSSWPGTSKACAGVGPRGGAENTPHAEWSVAKALPQGRGRWEGSVEGPGSKPPPHL